MSDIPPPTSAAVAKAGRAIYNHQRMYVNESSKSPEEMLPEWGDLSSVQQNLFCRMAQVAYETIFNFRAGGGR